MILRVVLLLTFALCSKTAYSCSCTMGDIEQKFMGARHVFIGKVVNVTYLNELNVFGDQKTIVDFEVEKFFKGEGQSITLHTAENGAGCTGWRFEERETYLVYTHIEAHNFDQPEAQKFNTMWCGGVIPKSDAKYFKKETKKIKKLAKKHKS